MFLVLLSSGCAGPAAVKVGDDTGGSPPVDAVLRWSVDPEIETLVRVAWDQAEAAEVYVEWSLDGATWQRSPTRSREAGPQSALLLGIPYESSATVRLGAASGPLPTPDTITVTTGERPAGLPEPELLVADPTRWEPSGNYLLGSINQDDGGWDQGRYWMWILDREGRTVWARRGVDENFTIYLRVSKNGDILWDESTWWTLFDEGAESKIHRMKIDGVETEVLDAPGMHHAFIELPDGSIVWGAGGDNSEKLLRRDGDGTVTTLWDCAPFYEELGLRDWCHTNSIFYVPGSDSLLLSFPTNLTFVVEVDRASGDELRWFGHVPDSWDFDPPDSAFQYQHGVTYTDTGTLLVSSQRSPSSIEGVVREYTLDEAGRTLHEIWSYGEGDGIPAQYAGEAHRLPNGNTLHNFGTTPRVQEITPEGTLAWDLAFEGSRLIGRTTWLEDLYQLAPPE